MAVLIDAEGVHIDWEAEVTSEKALTLVFLVLLVLSNSFLMLVVLVGQGHRVFSQPKYLVQLTLALAGIVTALYTEVVFAAVLYEQAIANCIVANVARILTVSFRPVLYGTGLFLLAADLALRARGASSTDRNPSALRLAVCAFGPWVIALVVVCPLTLTRVAWENGCRNDQTEGHLRAIVAVCTLVPTGLVLVSALAAAILVQATRRRSQYVFDGPMYDTGPNAKAVLQTVSSISLDTVNVHVAGHGSNPGQTQTKDDKNSHGHVDSSSLTLSSKNHRDYYNDLQRDLVVVCVTCAVFVVSVVPANALGLSILDRYDRTFHTFPVDTTDGILVISFMWLLNVYPVVIPILWVFL